METEQSTIEWDDFLRRDSVHFQTLLDIYDSISDLYSSINANYEEFERSHGLGCFSRNSGKALGKLIAFNKDEATKAEKLLGRLHSELQVVSSRVQDEVLGEHVQDKDGQPLKPYSKDTTWVKAEGYSLAWSKALGCIKMIFGMLSVKGKQMEELWAETDKATVMDTILREGEQGFKPGSELLFEILDKWVEYFGPEDLKDWLNELHAKTERETRQKEMKEKEARTKKEIKKTRKEFETVLDGVKKEMKDLKVESEGLRGELETLKKRKRV
ncbi:hypothetical protein V494_04996 [Pseudogymnoascus sp. VKM F-4513 (FW-928)]|nr:hypothetical protein V494_04996 [Pseudogymnoascus sp. VKM F-4513 (FW-928)]